MKHLLLAALLGTTAPALAQKKPVPAVSNVRYELRGVITYFFNDNLGNKPDIGAKAFIIKESVLRPKVNQIAALETYLGGHDLIERVGPSSDSKMQKMPDEMTAEDKIKALEDDALAIKQEIIGNTSTSEVTADGSGVFTKKLAPGSYLVMIRSGNRTRINPLESQGQLIIRHIIIKDDDKEVSANFNP